MRFPEFEMERMQSTWEHRVRYDLSESGVEPLTLAELAPELGAIAETRLGYAEGTGRDATRELVAALHPGATADNVLMTTGTSEANFLALTTIVEPGDDVVILMPNYMQLHGLARGLGANVREVWLHEDERWSLDLGRLRAAMTGRTKVICICTPNNPTGQILSAAELGAIAEVARDHGAWILSDEVYRGAEHDGVESATVWGRRERTIVTGGLSKAYGLPGLRVGWLVAPPDQVRAAWAQKDYTTIASASLSDVLEEVALRRRPELLARTREILNARWPVLEAWAKTHGSRLHWTPPRAGAICFFGYSYDTDSVPFVEALIRDRSTMVVPGAHFLAERHLRIGFGIPEATLRAGLAEIGAAFAALREPATRASG